MSKAPKPIHPRIQAISHTQASTVGRKNVPITLPRISMEKASSA